MGYVEELIQQGCNEEVLYFLLKTLPYSLININYERGCVEIFINDNNDVNNDMVDSYTEFKLRVENIKGKISDKQRETLNKYSKNNYHQRLYTKRDEEDLNDDDNDEDEGVIY